MEIKKQVRGETKKQTMKTKKTEKRKEPGGTRVRPGGRKVEKLKAEDD